MKRFFSLFLMVAMLFSLAACAPKEPAPQPDAATPDAQGDATAPEIGYETLIMGMDDTFAPMGFRDEAGELVGLDVDLAKAVSEKLGIPITFQPIDWSMKETELLNKNIDLIWNGYTITDARKEKVLFTKPYLKNSQIVAVKADSDIQTLADLADKTVAAQAESSAIDAIATKPEVQDSFKELVVFETNDQCIIDLDAGRSDAVVADEVLLRYVLAQRTGNEYRFLDEDFGDEEYGIGVRPEDTALADAVNQAFTDMKADGTLDKIAEKWAIPIDFE